MFIADGVEMMLKTPWLGGSVLVLTFFLLARQRIPAMFVIVIIGVVASYIFDPVQAKRLFTIPPSFHLPEFTFARMNWNDFVKGSLLLALPQIPLTLSNAIIAIRAENNELFPNQPVSDRMLAVSQGIMNLFAAPFGGIPLCHGAGGMAGHVRFGARTGGSPVMLGGIMIALALFFSQSVGLLFLIFPKALTAETSGAGKRIFMSCLSLRALPGGIWAPHS
jgi:MFS superfamily sulfate permease-like transporter